MRRSSWIAGILSLVAPGLGQIYAGEGKRGAFVLVGAIGCGKPQRNTPTNRNGESDHFVRDSSRKVSLGLLDTKSSP